MDRRRTKGFEEGSRAEGGPSVSLLVRARMEEAESGATSVKVFVRNLQTGREQYVGDSAQLGELVLRHLREAQRKESTPEAASEEISRMGS